MRLFLNVVSDLHCQVHLWSWIYSDTFSTVHSFRTYSTTQISIHTTYTQGIANINKRNTTIKFPPCQQFCLVSISDLQLNLIPSGYNFHIHNLYTIIGCFIDRNSSSSRWEMGGKSICLARVQNSQIFIWMGLSIVFVGLLWLHPVYASTHIHTLHTLLWILIHLLAIGPCNLPWGCWAVTITLFLFPFLCCILCETKDYTAVIINKLWFY